MLEETDPRLIASLAKLVGSQVGQESLQVYSMNTGGGCMVACIDLSLAGRGIGRQLWLTREDGWILGFYDFGADEEDEGVCVQLLLTESQLDDPDAIAANVAAILARVDFTTLDRPVKA